VKVYRIEPWRSFLKNFGELFDQVDEGHEVDDETAETDHEPARGNKNLHYIVKINTQLLPLKNTSQKISLRRM
jgi:hypothetical protein